MIARINKLEFEKKILKFKSSIAKKYQKYTTTN